MQRARSLAIYSIIALLSLAGCKEGTIFDAKIAPAVDNLNTRDTSLLVSCKTIYTDSIVTSYSFSGISIIHGLGTVTDPYFGKTNAGIYLQIVPQATSDFTFPAGAIYDSAVLILPYSGFTWGDTSLNIEQKVTAYRVTDQMYKDSIYYAFNTKNVDRAVPLGRATMHVDRLSDEVKVGVTTTDTDTMKSPHLRVKLDSTAFINMITTLPSSTLGSTSAFLAAFNGIYLEADPRSAGAAIPYFYLDGNTDYTRAGVLFYYHMPDDAATHTISFPYTSTYCAHFNHVSRNLRGSTAETIIGAAANNTNNILLQNLPGCMIDVTISGISHLPKALINKAQLVISQEIMPSDVIYSPPYRIYPIGIDAAGATYTIADGYPITSTGPLSFIDGVRTDPNGVSPRIHYLLNMPREVQAAIRAGRDSIHLHLTGTTDFPGAFRLIARGSDGSPTGIHFNVVYSTLLNQ